MKFSLIISTRGRTAEVSRLLDSLGKQTFQDFEVLLSDQNEDERLVPVLESSPLRDRILRLRSVGGASKGRNEGMAHARGEIVGFPDDDCTYPPQLLQDVADFFNAHPEWEFVSGRSYGDDGQDSVSRHARDSGPVAKLSIHAQVIEFALFVRRSSLGELRFDEQMGVGAPTPWHSDEGPDLVLRLMEKGERGYYESAIGIWHPRPVNSYDEKAIDRTYRYACGNGYFYRKHHYPLAYFAGQMMRTACGVLLAVLKADPGMARLYLARLRGRWRGWCMRA